MHNTHHTTPHTGTTHTSTGASSGRGAAAGSALKNTLGIVRGAGEAIRGEINTFADSAMSKKGASHNQPVTQHGVAGTSTGHHHGTGAGTGVMGTGMGTGSTNYGPHSSNLANKADPRVDSDGGMSIWWKEGDLKLDD